jgi:hypothetical protein
LRGKRVEIYPLFTLGENKPFPLIKFGSQSP